MLRFGIVNLNRPAFHPAGCVLMLNRSRSSVTAAQDDVGRLRPFEEIPGPKPLPLIGNTWRFLPIIGEYGGKDMHDVLYDMAEKYGKIAKLSGLRGMNDMVYLFDPSYVEVVFRNEGQWPIRPGIKTIPYYREVLRKDIYKGTHGVLISQGKKWFDFRSKVNQTMMQPRSAKLYVGPIDDVAKELINRMHDLKNERGELPDNFLEHLMRWALESISLIALDTRLGCLDPELKPDSEPMKLINAVNSLFDGMFELDTRPSPLHFTKRKEWKWFVEALDTTYEVAIKYINKSMERIQSKVETGDREMSVLETLLVKNEDPMIAVVMALDMMTAGIDTTSNATAVVMHHLARNQDTQEKVFQEVKSMLPSKDEPLTAKKLEDMKYLKACIRESMRLHPITAGTARETQDEVVIANYIIPKGVTVIVPSKYLSSLEEHFPQHERFMPERWIKGPDKKEKINPFVSMPFGFGPRMCVGRRFAELEMETLLSRIIRNFRFEYNQELKINAGIINSVVSPLNFKLENRSG